MTFFTEHPVTTADATFFQLRKDIVEGDIEAGSMAKGWDSYQT